MDGFSCKLPRCERQRPDHRDPLADRHGGVRIGFTLAATSDPDRQITIWFR